MAYFNDYIVAYYTAPPSRVTARIWLHNSHNNGALVAVLDFMSDGEKIPANFIQQTPYVIHLHFPINHLANIMSILKDEEPLNVGMFTADIGYIQTDHEPVGEQEGV